MRACGWVLVFGLVIGLMFTTLGARAEPANRYGEKGRTVLLTGLSGEVSGSGFTQSHSAWQASARLTLVHFVVDNFAIGGTLAGDLRQLRDTGFANEPVLAYGGGDLDVIGHLPLSRHLSFRLWAWVGLRQARRRQAIIDSYYGDNIVVTASVMQVAFGFLPQLLLHLSSSTALAFGPALRVFIPVESWVARDWSLNFGPTVSYSFGAAPREPGDPDAEPVVPRFAARGRNVLMGGLSIGTDMGVSAGYARFVRDHFALGPYVLGGAVLREIAKPYWAGAGLQMLAELPLKARWSLLFVPQVGYRFDRMAELNFQYFSSDGSSYELIYRTMHELQFTGSVLPVVHLFEALVLGAGPTITEHVRLASSDALSTAYLSLGITSMLAGSF